MRFIIVKERKYYSHRIVTCDYYDLKIGKCTFEKVIMCVWECVCECMCVWEYVCVRSLSRLHTFYIYSGSQSVFEISNEKHDKTSFFIVIHTSKGSLESPAHAVSCKRHISQVCTRWGCDGDLGADSGETMGGSSPLVVALRNHYRILTRHHRLAKHQTPVALFRVGYTRHTLDVRVAVARVSVHAIRPRRTEVLCI